MAQHDLNIANQGFPAFRSDLNNALSAIQTTHSGTTRPTGAVAGQIWLDTTSATSPTLKYYDGADDISLATIDHSANTVNWLDSTVSITGLSTTATGTVLTLSDTASTSTVNLIIDNQKQIRFRETTANGTNYVALQAPASVSADLTFTLPATDGTNGQALITNGSGVLSFSTISTSLATPLEVVGNATAGSEIRLPEDTDNGSNYVALKAPDTLSADLTLTLPSADGTSGQVLQTNGSGVLSFSSPSSDFVLLATTNITSATASVSFDGYFSSTYKNYKIIASHVTGSATGISTGVYFITRYRRSNADISTSNYRSQLVWSYNCDGSESGVNQGFSEKSTARGLITIYDLSNTTAKSVNSEIILYDPLGTTNYKYTNVQSSYFSLYCGHNSLHHLTGTTVLEDNANALSGISFLFSSGNITNGNFKLYGIK